MFSSKHVANLNCSLNSIKFDTIVDFIYIDYWGLIVITNKVTSSSNLSVVKSYIKNTNSVDSNNIQSTYLLQSKLYLKILDILYLIESTNTQINSSVIKSVIKSTHIFNVMRRFGHGQFVFSFPFIFWLYRIFIFIFILFLTMKRHMTLQSHDMSHDVMS